MVASYNECKATKKQEYYMKVWRITIKIAIMQTSYNDNTSDLQSEYAGLIPVVCSTCNNGEMSQNDLNAAAENVLKRLDCLKF